MQKTWYIGILLQKKMSVNRGRILLRVMVSVTVLHTTERVVAVVRTPGNQHFTGIEHGHAHEATTLKDHVKHFI